MFVSRPPTTSTRVRVSLSAPPGSNLGEALLLTAAECCPRRAAPRGGSAAARTADRHQCCRRRPCRDPVDRHPLRAGFPAARGRSDALAVLLVVAGLLVVAASVCGRRVARGPLQAALRGRDRRHSRPWPCCLAIAAPLAVATRYAYVQRDLVLTVFDEDASARWPAETRSSRRKSTRGRARRGSMSCCLAATPARIAAGRAPTP